MGICYIVGAGECTELDFIKQADDIVIAADGGLIHLQNAGIVPDLVIGDFDSLGEVPQGNIIIKLNPVKDITDMSAAVDIGSEKGFGEFHIYGACGGRLDHTLANIQLAASISQKNMKVYIHDGATVITALTDSSAEFDSSHKGYISLFSHTDECSGVCIEGLKYNLSDTTLKNNFPLGVSNEFVGAESKIVIGKGTAILIYSK